MRRKEKAARGGPEKSFCILENKPESPQPQAPSSFMQAFAAPYYVPQAADMARQLRLPLRERYADSNPAVIAVRKADAAFFAANPSRLFHLRRAIKAEWMVGPKHRAGDLVLACREPAGLVLVLEVRATRPLAELDTEELCIALFDRVTARWKGPLIAELRRKRALRWAH